MNAPPTPPLLRRLLLPLRESDPALLRLTQALKTGLAVLLALLLLRHATVQTRLFAGIGAGFLMQYTSTGPLRRRQLTMLISAAAMALCTFVAAGPLAGHPYLQDALLLLVAFAVFYVRRFLPDQGLFPIFGFVITLLATALPTGRDIALAEAGALALAFVVSFLIHFYLLPPDPRKAFIDGLHLFVTRAARALALLETALRHRAPFPTRPARALHDALVAGLAFSQQLVEQWGPALAAHPHSPPYDARDPLLRQYEATHALLMLGDNVRRLTAPDTVTHPSADCPDELPPHAYDQLADLLAALRDRFHDLDASLKARAFHASREGEAPSEPSSESPAITMAGPPARTEARPPQPRPDLDAHALQTAVLDAHHPLCPKAAHLFSALVAAQQLENLQRELARTANAPPPDPTGLPTSVGHAPADAQDSPATPPALSLRTPIRAAVSVAIALLVGRVFQLERSYWAVLVSIILVNGTWGENTRRAMIRFGMTVAGCAAALALLHVAGPHHAARVATLVVGIVAAAYFRNYSYPLMTFFITLYVIVLFSLTGQSPRHVLLVRIFETFIGCLVALAASLLVPPPRATRKWQDQLKELRQTTRQVVARAFDMIAPTDTHYSSFITHYPLTDAPHIRDLMSQLRALRATYQAAAYEGVFSGPARRQRRQAMDHARRLAHHALSLAEAARAPHDPTVTLPLHPDLAALGHQILTCLPDPPTDPQPTDAPLPTHHSSLITPQSLDNLQQHLRQQSLTHPLPLRELAWLGSVIYHARQLCPTP